MKKYLKLLILGVMVFALTGCMKINTTVDVNSDATMTMKMDMLVGESYLSKLGVSVEEAINKMQEQAKSSDSSLTDSNFKTLEKTIDGVKWVGYSVEQKSSKETTLVKQEKIDGKDSLVLTLPMDKATGGTDASSITSQAGSVSSAKAMGMEMTVTINMPNKPTSNVGTVDGNKVTIDLLDLVSKGTNGDIVVSCESSSFPTGLILGGVGLVAIVGIVLVILKKNKKPTDEASMIENDDSVQSTEETSVEQASEEVGDAPTEKSEESSTTEDGFVEESTTEEVKGFCTQCGEAVASDVDYCPSCGNKLK